MPTLLPLQASQGSYAVDTDSPLFRAKLKYRDSCSIKSSDATACFQLGRLCLLLGEREEAVKYLKNALAQRPTHSPTRFCLGLALGKDQAKHAKLLIYHGLTQYLQQVSGRIEKIERLTIWSILPVAQLQELHETQADVSQVPVRELYSQTFYRSTNTLIVRQLLNYA